MTPAVLQQLVSMFGLWLDITAVLPHSTSGILNNAEVAQVHIGMLTANNKMLQTEHLKTEQQETLCIQWHRHG